MDKAIKKIVLDLGGKEVTLTPEQAKNLKTALDELFGKQVVKEIHHHDHYQPYYWWYWDSTPAIPYRQDGGLTFTSGNVTWDNVTCGNPTSYTDGTLRLTG